MEGEEKTLYIRDLIEIPDIKTVIQLEDLKDSNLRRMIIETFVLTGEVQDNLRAIFTCFSGREGRGIFLKGHFGSGKSHFLSMLSLLLKHPRSWETVLSQAPSLGTVQRELGRFRPLVVEISLVQHRGSEFLEDVVLRAIFENLGDEAVDSFDGTETRHEAFSRLKGLLKNKGFEGMVLLIDELSEFLRSKADARAYNEDIRFLQYLGEEAGTFPLWVVASLQEWIEETGEIHQDTFNKIKDRYRIRLNLGRAHIEELVSERLIRHKENAESKIGEVFDELISCFPTFPVSKDRFTSLYPVHPATVSLLDRLKPLFSEHRGVVDFIHYRLTGDTERHIPSMLDRPAHHLLTPEVIFDHFLDRIRESSETQIYVQRVFEAYQEEIPEHFKDTDQQRIALVAIKLLILFAISPVKFKYTVRHMAEMVLFQITPLEAEINYQFLYDILDRLAREGSYIRVEAGDDPLDNHYFIDLKADVAGMMRKRIRHAASELFPEDQRLFTKLAAMVTSPYLPLEVWVEKGRQQVSVQWQHTHRNGTLLLRQMDELSHDEVDGLARQWARSEEDFFILVGTTHNRDNQYRHIKQSLLPRILDHHPGTFLFWLPAASEGDLDWLKEMLAAVLMLEAMSRESSGKGQQGRDVLQAFIDRGRDRLIEYFTHHYFHGVLIWDENQVDLSRFGLLSQEKFLAEFVHPLLERRFPRHSRIQPYMDALAPGILTDMLRDFLSKGMLLVHDRSKFGIRDVLEGLLRPMGLVKKKGNQYELQVHPKQNELVQHFFEEMGQRESVSLEDMYWIFRKGEYGLLRPHYEIMVLAMLFSGHLVAYKGSNRKGPDELARTGLKGITTLGKGEILGEKLRQAITDHPLIPQRFKDVPITLASQEELWAEIKARKPAVMEDLETLKSRIHWAASFEAFKNMPWKNLLKDLEDLTAQWDEVKVSLPAREGLERFISAGLKEPFLEKKIMALEDCQKFLGQAERALFIYRYVTDPKLHIPDTGAYLERTYAHVRDAQEIYGHDDLEQLRQTRSEILSYFEEPQDSLSPDAWEEVQGRFQGFQEGYIRAYTDAHRRERGGEQFQPYEQLTHSKRYRILKRLDQLEMISVEHNRRSIDQGLSSVLLQRCQRSPQDYLQGQPACSCGFRLGEALLFKPLMEIEKEIDLGIAETVEALQAPAIQEKVLPYLQGLELVGKREEADTIRQLLHLSTGEQGFLDRMDQLLTPGVIQNINEAFRGKVVVVKKDLDQLYQSLIHRKYTLTQTRKIIQDWLGQEAISEDTFLHFLGMGERDPADRAKEAFLEILESDFNHLTPLYRETGHDRLIKATITSLWAGQYNLPVEKILDMFPFLERGGKAENEHWVRQLIELAQMLRSEKPDIFDSLASQAEDTSLIQTLWAALPSLSPAEIFKEESMFPLVLKEAFERLLCSKAERLDLPELVESTESKSMDGSIFQGRKSDMVEALKAHHLIREKGSGLKAPMDTGPESFAPWEGLFIQTMSSLPFLKEKLHEKLERIGTEVPPFLREEERAMAERLHEITEDFVRFYRHALPVWEKGEGPRPLMIQDIPSLLSKKRGVPDHRAVYYLLMDGMRWDLWEAIKSDFFGRMPNHFRIVREGAFWANQPTNTAAQLALFEQAFQAIHGSLDDTFWKISGIDEKIHTEKGPLTHLVANVISYLEIDLLFRLRRLPPRTLLIIFADHGFVENPAFTPTDKYESPRYVHGKDSPFEVIVPWAWIMRL
jgi:energy-coupling factor transporter ATP-binding protein EcfA2